MKSLISLIFLLAGFQAAAEQKPVVIAVIDTGFTISEKVPDQFLCKYGHKDFSGANKFETFLGTVTPVPVDNFGHGTNVVGLIRQYANKTSVPYCILVLKFFDTKSTTENPLTNEVEAIKYATSMGASIINYSGGGEAFSTKERDAVQAFIERGGIFVAAAGNERHDDISKHPYYPAMFPGVISVGNLGINGQPLASSNRGSAIKRWETGEDRTAFGITMTGTSQAAAVASGKILGEKFFLRDTQTKTVAIRK